MDNFTEKFTQELNIRHGERYTFAVVPGRKFDKILQSYGKTGHHGSVHAFVERATGKLIKPASWSSPQKGVNGLAYRYDLSTPEGFARAVEKSDPYGSYLYEGRN